MIKTNLKDKSEKHLCIFGAAPNVKNKVGNIRLEVSCETTVFINIKISSVFWVFEQNQWIMKFRLKLCLQFNDASFLASRWSGGGFSDGLCSFNEQLGLSQIYQLKGKLTWYFLVVRFVSCDVVVRLHRIVETFSWSSSVRSGLSVNINYSSTVSTSKRPRHVGGARHCPKASFPPTVSSLGADAANIRLIRRTREASGAASGRAAIGDKTFW